MIALCVESSHQRGMGHLYRAMNLLAAVEARGERARILVNGDEAALAVLRARGIEPRVVDLGDEGADWEASAVRELGAAWWIDDRLATSASHARRVKATGARLATFDNRGDGAALADVHFAPLQFGGSPLAGGKVLRGVRWLVLDPGIARFRRLRTRPGRLVVSLGGSDTYGATVRVVKILRAAGRAATVIVGPSFRHDAELSAAAAGGAFEIKRGVPSLAEEFSRHETAVTGGGVTAFEAAAAGLPTIVVGNETWEEEAGRYLEAAGASVFAGPHHALDEEALLRPLNLERMSRAAMAAVDLDGARRVCEELLAHG